MLLPSTNVRKLGQKILLGISAGWELRDLSRSAIVFSPHYDDETLGCGGTIVKKIRAGARVHVAFMTDGAASHRHLFDAAALAHLRSAEAFAACGVLGVPAADVHMLNFPDGRLKQSAQQAQTEVLRLLRQCRPEEIYVPFRREAPLDHLMTNHIVLAAARQWQAEALRPVVVFEYPVWFWCHWPWVKTEHGSGRAYAQWAGDATRGWLDTVRRLRTRVRIDDVLPVKRAALAEHKSQMTRLLPHPAWLTLQDVGGGEFLDCFFRSHELFWRYSIG